MTDAHQPNREQAALWNETSGRAWVQLQSVLDRMLEPFTGLLIEHALRDETRRVLDIGCGAGSTTLSVARRLGPGGRCWGIDISATLIEAAKKRALTDGVGNAQFIHADAQTHAFEPNRFDSIISRFGVMFFDDPTTAFANIRHAARSDATLGFVAWRSAAENPFMTTAARAAAPFLPALPAADPNAPGQFAFADADRVRRILATSGWNDIDIQSIDIPVRIAQQDLLAYVTRLGPVGHALADMDEPRRARIATVVRAAFDPFIQDGAACFDAACWFVSARR